MLFLLNDFQIHFKARLNRGGVLIGLPSSAASARCPVHMAAQGRFGSSLPRGAWRVAVQLSSYDGLGSSGLLSADENDAMDGITSVWVHRGIVERQARN